MDWSRIILDLRESGLTLAQIAEQTGYSVSSLSEVSTGQIKEPKHSIGVALLALHNVRVGKPSADHLTSKVAA